MDELGKVGFLRVSNRMKKGAWVGEVTQVRKNTSQCHRAVFEGGKTRRGFTHYH